MIPDSTVKEMGVEVGLLCFCLFVCLTGSVGLFCQHKIESSSKWECKLRNYLHHIDNRHVCDHLLD